MSAPTQPTQPAGAVTAQYDFCNVNPEGKMLFSVRGGIPLGDAFNQLSVLMGSTMGALDQIACDQDAESAHGALWQSIHMMELSFAVVQAMHGGFVAYAAKTGGDQ